MVLYTYVFLCGPLNTNYSTWPVIRSYSVTVIEDGRGWIFLMKFNEAILYLVAVHELLYVSLRKYLGGRLWLRS